MHAPSPWTGALIPDWEQRQGRNSPLGVSGKQLGEMLGFRTTKPGTKQPYELLAARLASLGFHTYRSYLRSDGWISRRGLCDPGPDGCYVCGRVDVEIHHLDYSALGEERARDLLPLCNACHTGVHQLVDVGTASLRTAAEDYKRLADDFVVEYVRRTDTHPEPAHGRAFLAYEAFARYVLPDRLRTAAGILIRTRYRTDHAT